MTSTKKIQNTDPSWAIEKKEPQLKLMGVCLFVILVIGSSKEQKIYTIRYKILFALHRHVH